MSEPKQLFFDESGNTGVDLLDINQPIFALASTTIDSEIAAALIAPLLAQGQTEAKYSRLRTSNRGRNRLAALLSSPELSNENTTICVVDKQFYLVTQIVDKLIEPLFYEQGIDIYAGDMGLSMSRVYYYTGNHMFPHGDWDRLLASLLVAIRQRTTDAFQAFDRILMDSAARSDSHFSKFVGYLLDSHGRLGELIGIYSDVEVFDPAVDSFVSLIQHEMKKSPGMLSVTHDQSKPLARTESFLRALMSPSAGAREFGYGNRKMELPLRISELSFADSKDFPQLQIADLLAGAAIDCLLALSGERPALDYHAKLQDSRLFSLFEGSLLPEFKISAAPEPGPGEVNIPDGQMQFLKDSGFLDQA